MHKDRAEGQGADSHDFDHEGGRRWSNTLAWAPFLVLMWLVFELTADPALGVAAGCVKFGLKDLGTARWLRRVDPVRVRGRACSWFCVTRGILKIGAMAEFVLVACFAIDTSFGIGWGAFTSQIIVAVLTILSCIALASMSAAIGVLISWRNGIKIWVDDEVNLARKLGLWPPVVVNRNGRFVSFAGIVVLVAVLGAILLAMVIYFTVGFLWFVDFRNNRELFTLILGGFAWLAVPFPLTARYFGRRVIATVPWECYPLE